MKITIDTQFASLFSNLRLEIIRLLIENNGMTQKELAKQLNINESTLSQNLKVLESIGVITRKKMIITENGRFKHVKYVYYNDDNQIIDVLHQ